jgi:hypothetical protein
MNLVARDDGSRPEDVSLVIHSTAGSGTMTVTAKLHGYCPGAAAWAPMGVAADDTTKGTVNQGNTIDETSADSIRHAEPVTGVFDFARLYLELTAIGGTNTAVTAWLQWRR